MEPIKIVDKLTLRQEALRMAIERARDDEKITSALELAKKYAIYLQGNADLPEFVDTESFNRKMVEIATKIQEDVKPKPIWNSIPRKDDGTILAPWIDTLRQTVPFCLHDSKHNKNVFVADETEFTRIWMEEITKNPRYDAYCSVELPELNL